MQASKKPSNSAKPKPTVASRKRPQTSQSDARESKKSKTTAPQLTEAEKAKDDKLASDQLATLSLPPSSGEPPAVAEGSVRTQAKKHGSATKATKSQKGKGVAKPSPANKQVVPQIVPQVDVGRVFENVETAIEQADPDAGVPGALREAVKLEIDYLIDFSGMIFQCFPFM